MLELGSVPLPIVTARIDRFIAEGGKGPYPDMEYVGRGCFGKQPMEVDDIVSYHDVLTAAKKSCYN